MVPAGSHWRVGPLAGRTVDLATDPANGSGWEPREPAVDDVAEVALVRLGVEVVGAFESRQGRSPDRQVGRIIGVP